MKMEEYCINNPEYQQMLLIPENCNPFLQQLDLGIDRIFKA
jgi:hypothetical protein